MRLKSKFHLDCPLGFGLLCDVRILRPTSRFSTCRSRFRGWPRRCNVPFFHSSKCFGRLFLLLECMEQNKPDNPKGICCTGSPGHFLVFFAEGQRQNSRFVRQEARALKYTIAWRLLSQSHFPTLMHPDPMQRGLGDGYQGYLFGSRPDTHSHTACTFLPHTLG